jgi:hypothetical protein
MNPRTTTRVVAVLASLLAVACVAYAQNTANSHYFVGDFKRINQSNARQFAIWSTQDNRYIQASVGNVAGNAVRVIAHPSRAAAYVLFQDGNGDTVMYYDMETDSWTALGEKSNGGDRYSDIVISGNTLYVCGSFSFSQRTNPVYNFAQRALDATPRTLWATIDVPAGGSVTFPGCDRIFKPSGSTYNLVVLDNNGDISWQLAGSKSFVNTPTAAASNIRAQGQTGASSVSPSSMKQEGGYIYASGSFNIDPDATSIYQIVRTQDGVSWSGVLRFPTTGNYGNLLTYTVIGNEVFWVGSQDVNGITRYSLFKATITSGESAPTRIGEYLETGNNPTADQMFAVGNTIMGFTPDDILKMTEGDVDNAPQQDSWRHRRYIDTGVSQIAADGSGGWTWGMGGGFTDASGATVVATAAAQSATGGYIFVIGGFERAWDGAAYGMAAYSEEKRMFVPFGFVRMDSVGHLQGAGYPYTDPQQFRTVHAYMNNDGRSQTVIVGGDFARINNRTLNSIAYISSADGTAGMATQWSALATGLSRTGAANTFNEIVIERPALINAITSHPLRRGTGQVIYAGGRIASAGSVGVSNVARYELGTDQASMAWTGMKGGVNGEVYALDSADRRFVYVGGSFTRAGNNSATNIAMWDDELGMWNNMRGGVNGVVRSIYARGSRSVLVAGAFTMAGGVPVSNIALWDGEIWTSIGCDTCKSDCDSATGLSRTCTPSGVTDYYEIKNIGGKIYLLADNGEVLCYDGNLYTVYKPQLSSAGLTAGEQRLARVPRDAKGQLWVAGTSATSTVTNFWTRITEYSVENRNIYPVRGGFDDIVRTVSPAAAVGPLAALILAVAALLALFM